MSGIFNLDAPIWTFMGEIADIIILGLLWWCGCLGIVTIGASTTALYYVLGKKIRKEQTYVAKDFFKSFKQNLKQSVPLSVLITVAFISLSLYGSFVITGLFQTPVPSYMKYMVPLTIVFAFEVLNFNTYIWALLSRFDMKTKAMIKTAFIMTHRHLLTTLANIGVLVAVAFGIFKFPLLIVAAPSIVVWGKSFMIQKIFTGYIEAANEEKNKEEQIPQDEGVSEFEDQGDIEHQTVQ